MQSPLPIHGKSILFGLVIIGALAALQQRTVLMPESPTFDVLIEHTEPVLLTFVFTEKLSAGLLELTLESETGATIGLPVEWERTQVRNGALASVIRGEASVGFRRWKIPAGATVSYAFRGSVGGIRILNPDQRPMEVRFSHINLDTGKTLEDSRLFSGKNVTLP